jgi:proline dehydrogenase
MYKKSLDEFLKRISEKSNLSVVVATHNEDTIRYAVKKMEDLNISPSSPNVSFGQLYGMCDHVSFTLGQAGYSVYKYLPYGPVLEVLPYLGRRVEENKGILEKVKKERRLMRKEIVRRLARGQLMYSP